MKSLDRNQEPKSLKKIQSFDKDQFFQQVV